MRTCLAPPPPQVCNADLTQTTAYGSGNSRAGSTLSTWTRRNSTAKGRARTIAGW
jgi:hypothetical protein